MAEHDLSENLSGLSLSFDSSSFGNKSSDEERNIEVAPYQFEPYSSDADSDINEVGSGDSETEEQDRLNNTDWCLCGCCVSMPTSRESICCQEIARMVEKVADMEVSCVTNHPGFDTVCLDMYVLETAYYQYRQQYGAREGSLEECLCGCCVSMPTSRESICCQEIARMVEKVADVEVSCVTNHPGFDTVCLDMYVLETAYYQYRQQYGARGGSLEERNRYTAYRQLVRWCWGYLGRNVRVPLPSCAVKKIGSAFPSENYRGFHDDM